MPAHCSLWAVTDFYTDNNGCSCEICELKNKIVVFNSKNGDRFEAYRYLYPDAKKGDRYFFDAITRSMQPIQNKVIEVEL